MGTITSLLTGLQEAKGPRGKARIAIAKQYKNISIFLAISWAQFGKPMPCLPGV